MHSSQRCIRFIIPSGKSCFCPCLQSEMCCLFGFVIIPNSSFCQCGLQGSQHMLMRGSKVRTIWGILLDLKSQSLNGVDICSSHVRMHYRVEHLQIKVLFHDSQLLAPAPPSKCAVLGTDHRAPKLTLEYPRRK